MEVVAEALPVFQLLIQQLLFPYLFLLSLETSLSAPEVTWSLADHGFNVVALTRRGRASALRHSRFARVIEVTAPGSDATKALADLNAVCARVKQSSGRVGLMPLDDEAVLASLKVKNAFISQ